jgi:hypothetical protein
MSTQIQNKKTTQSDVVQPQRKKASEQKSRPSRKIKRLLMVGWYDPRQLAKTGIEVAVSTIFGRHSDHRLVEAMASGDEGRTFYDYTYHYEDNGEDICQPDTTNPRDSIWLDYVGDVGDGWNSTYAIAYYLAETGRTYTYTDRNTGHTHQAETKRGDLGVDERSVCRVRRFQSLPLSRILRSLV